MNSSYCNVALPVPLRMTFTYAVPAELSHQVQIGCRVLVPFRKKSLVGVVVELTESVPLGTKIREIEKVLDSVPALTAKLVALGQWIAGYYLAPIGEVFRGMLPPITDLSSRREIVLTEGGRALAAEMREGKPQTDLSPTQAEFLRKLREKKGAALVGPAARMGIALDELQKLQRRGMLEIREMVRGRKRKTHNIISWKGIDAPSVAELDEKEQRIQAMLQTERGPLPMPQL